MKISAAVRTAASLTLLAAVTVGWRSNASARAGCCRPAAPAATPSATAQPTASAPAGVPRLVDLGADKCIPCKKMAPILEEIRKEYHGVLDVEFIDVWKDPTAGRKYGIRLIPTQIFYDPSGKEIFRHEGFMGKEDILNTFGRLGIKLAKPGS